MPTNDAKTDFLENKVLQHFLKGTVYTQPTGLWIALYTASPGESGAGTEVSGGGYARQPVTFTVTGNVATNTGEVNFGQATANWGTVTHWAIVDAVTAGNRLWYGATENAGGVNTGFAVNNGDTFRFPASSITITEE